MKTGEEMRIRRMEACFDALLQMVKEPERLKQPDGAEKLAILKAYYTGGQWLRDYERDERGLLPAGLKRGVLSQDGLHDLLAEIARLTSGEEHAQV